LLDERVKVSSERAGMDAESVAELVPYANKTRGNPIDYILDRTLLRPRDAIAYLNECLARGVGKTRLSWDDIQGAEHEYSSRRLLALRDEWKPTYPGIDRVMDKFQGAPGRMTKGEFQTRLEECMLLISDPAFTGVRWMTTVSRTMWEGSESSWFTLYQPLASILYRLGVIGCGQRAASAPVFFSADRLLMDPESSVDRIEFFYVHRMLHKALDIRLSTRGN